MRSTMWNLMSEYFNNIIFHKDKRIGFEKTQKGSKKGGATLMWTQATMDVGTSVIVSALGLSVVFTTLVVLALAILAISKILQAVIKEEVKKPAVAAPVAVSDEADKETLAVLMATIGMDLDLPTDQFKIVDVKEVK